MWEFFSIFCVVVLLCYAVVFGGRRCVGGASGEEKMWEVDVMNLGSTKVEIIDKYEQQQQIKKKNDSFSPDFALVCTFE